MLVIAVNETPTGKSRIRSSAELSRCFVRISGDVWLAEIPERVFKQALTNLKSFASKKTHILFINPGKNILSHKFYVVGNSTNNRFVARISGDMFSETIQENEYVIKKLRQLIHIIK